MGSETGTGRSTVVCGRLTGVWAKLEPIVGVKVESVGAMACLRAGGMGTQARQEYSERTSLCFPGGQGCRGRRAGMGVLVGGLYGRGPRPLPSEGRGEMRESTRNERDIVIMGAVCW